MTRGGQAPAGSRDIPGSRDFFQNPDPGILKNLIPGFFGISKSLKTTVFQGFHPFNWPWQLVLRPLITAGGSKITFKLLIFQQKYSTWINSHWFNDAGRNQSINEIFTCHLFRAHAHMSQQTEVWFENHTGFYFFRCKAGSFLGHHVASDTENLFALAACHRDGKDYSHQESKKR